MIDKRLAAATLDQKLVVNNLINFHFLFICFDSVLFLVTSLEANSLLHKGIKPESWVLLKVSSYFTRENDK